MTPTQKEQSRKLIASLCASARANEPRIHYSQVRPFTFVDNLGVGWHTLDCSGFVVNCFWNVMHDLKLYVVDPSGQRYSGWGNTWTIEAWLREHGKRVTEVNGFLVGDVAMFDGHTMICSKKGSATTSDWTSHGTEGGPNLRKLNYRPDLNGVWRHPAFL